MLSNSISFSTRSTLVALVFSSVAFWSSAALPAHAALYRVRGRTEVLDRFQGNTITFPVETYDHTGSLSEADGIGSAFSNPNLDPGLIYRTESYSTARAAQGSAGVRTSTSFRRNYISRAVPSRDDLRSQRANASAEVTLEDVVIEGPAGNVTTSFNMHVGGFLSTGVDVDMNTSGVPQMLAAADVFIQFRADGNVVGEGFAQQIISPVMGQTLSSSGLLNTFMVNGNTVVTSQPFTVPANTPFTLRFLIASASVSTLYESDSGFASSVSDFLNTLSFATDRPVFNLGPDYTASSPTGGIIANQYAIVPEPNPLGLLLIGLTIHCTTARHGGNKTCRSESKSQLPTV